MKILFIFLLLGGNALIASNDAEMEVFEQTAYCDNLAHSPIRVQKCKLVPDTDALLKCGEYFRKTALEEIDYSGGNNDSVDDTLRGNAIYMEEKAQEAWDKGGKMMIEREPITKKERCGYYLDCLTSYVETLPTFAPDGRPLKHEQFESWQQYDKLLLECANGMYTITTGIKKVEEKSPGFKRWMGKNTPRLSRITTKESKQVIFIKPRGGDILNVPLPDSASSERTSQKYVMNAHKCLYELKEEDERNKHINTAPVYVFSTDGKGRPQRDMKFTNKTDLNFKISNVEPIIQISWKDVEKFVPAFHKKGTYIAKNILLKEQTYDFPELRKAMSVDNLIVARSLLNPSKAIDSEELCGITMVPEALHGQLILRNAEKIAYDYDIDFRPANKSEISKANRIIRRMKNWSGSYTEEKGIYDSLNNPFYTPKYKGQKREPYDGKEESTGILDVIIDKDIKADDYEPSWAEKDLANEILEEDEALLKKMELQMFTK